MAANSIAAAQRGLALADALQPRQRSRSGAAAQRRTGARKRAAGAEAAGSLTGPFLSPGSLTTTERLRLIDAMERVLEGVYTHLPLKRARYGFDPVQRPPHVAATTARRDVRCTGLRGRGRLYAQDRRKAPRGDTMALRGGTTGSDRSQPALLGHLPQRPPGRRHRRRGARAPSSRGVSRLGHRRRAGEPGARHHGRPGHARADHACAGHSGAALQDLCGVDGGKGGTAQTQRLPPRPVPTEHPGRAVLAHPALAGRPRPPALIGSASTSCSTGHDSSHRCSRNYASERPPRSSAQHPSHRQTKASMRDKDTATPTRHSSSEPASTA